LGLGRDSALSELGQHADIMCPSSKELGGGLGLGGDSASSKLGCGVRDDGSQAGEHGTDDDSGIGVVSPGECEYTEGGWINK
jgi:hypothetical protein